MSASERKPFIAIIDDDEFSARLLMRNLTAVGAGSVKWLGNVEQCRDALDALFFETGNGSLNMLVVDLKSSSGATLEFITSIASEAEAADLPVIAMAQSDDRAMRSALYAAGAAGVFVRHADRRAYRNEVLAILKFWSGLSGPAMVGM